MLHSFHQDVLRKLPEDFQVRPNMCFQSLVDALNVFLFFHHSCREYYAQ